MPPVGAEAMPTVSFKRRGASAGGFQPVLIRCCHRLALPIQASHPLLVAASAPGIDSLLLQPLLRLALPLHRCTAGGVDATLSETERYNARPVRADLLMAEALRLAKRPRAIDDWTGDHDYDGFFFT